MITYPLSITTNYKLSLQQKEAEEEGGNFRPGRSAPEGERGNQDQDRGEPAGQGSPGKTSSWLIGLFWIF
jgi:hypothetical protein